MVNTVNVSAYEGSPPAGDEGRRILTGSPLYPSGLINKLLEKGCVGFEIWTKKGLQNLKKWRLDHDDVLELLKIAITNGRYLGSLWCVQKPTGPWAACDHYSVMRKEWCEAAFKDMVFEYYVKFAVNKSGKLLLVVSCPPSEDRS
ncbi:hypothetical protein [Endozoicomonas numazuensis]|uniref:Uncharacterized protein n=1 Tax=Endozoicomonas numazuensis TaxID=1137799 RepID=A0A081NLI4_9GAMM|nr:hypothetical protein [Endozoicomonas numazuensis]KEQ19307.1 hypothetical protein GZ78_04830 [Endozoicomonas numazuensis]